MRVFYTTDAEQLKNRLIRHIGQLVKYTLEYAVLHITGIMIVLPIYGVVPHNNLVFHSQMMEFLTIQSPFMV